MNLGNIAWTVFAVQIVLHYSTGGFIVAGDAFPKLGDERIEGQYSRVAVDSIHQINRGHHIDFAVQHPQGVYRELAFSAADTAFQQLFVDAIAPSRNISGKYLMT